MTAVAVRPSPSPPLAQSRAATNAPTVWLLLAAVGALALALRLPVATTVLGLVAFGVLHNVLELRYVTGRFDGILAGPFLWLLGVLITGVLVCRLLPVSAVTRGVEIGLCYVVLGVAVVRALAHRRLWMVAALAGLAVAAAVSLTFPAYHFVVLTHLHNLVPLFFLWEWSKGLSGPPRWGFRAANLAWVIGIPALILAGAFDGLLRAAPAGLGGLGGVAAFEPGRLVASYAPPALAADLGIRFLAVFAFMQTMHYVVWVGVLPRYAPEAAARFDTRVPMLRGGRAWLLGGGLALLLGVVFALDYAQGKTLYAAGATYHAYLEFPVLLALVLAYPRLAKPRGERP
jgi:hypothetical protein